MENNTAWVGLSLDGLGTTDTIFRVASDLHHRELQKQTANEAFSLLDWKVQMEYIRRARQLVEATKGEVYTAEQLIAFMKSPEAERLHLNSLRETIFTAVQSYLNRTGLDVNPEGLTDGFLIRTCTLRSVPPCLGSFR